MVWYWLSSCRCRPNQEADFWRCSVQTMPAQQPKCIVTNTQERLMAYTSGTVDTVRLPRPESSSPSIFMVLGMNHECTVAGSCSRHKRLQELASLHQSPVPCFTSALCIAMSSRTSLGIESILGFLALQRVVLIAPACSFVCHTPCFGLHTFELCKPSGAVCQALRLKPAAWSVEVAMHL